MFKRIRWWWLKKAGRGASTFVKCILTFFSSLEKFAKNMAFIVFYGIVLVILYIVIVENYKLNFRKMVENIKHLQFKETKMPIEPSANPQKGPQG